MRLLRRFRCLAAPDKRLLIETAFLLASIGLVLRLVSFRTLQDLLVRILGQTRRTRAAASFPSDRIAWAIAVASRYVPGAQNCLVQALAAWTLLAWRHHAGLLHIGVTNGPDRQFKAHAWVEHDGKVLVGGGPNLASYTTLFVRGAPTQ